MTDETTFSVDLIAREVADTIDELDKQEQGYRNVLEYTEPGDPRRRMFAQNVATLSTRLRKELLPRYREARAREGR